MTSSLPKWLITGGHGQLAQTLMLHPLAKKFQLITLPRTHLDITHTQQLHHYLNKNPLQGIIHTAAYTAVDQAEIEKDLAKTVNYIGTKNIALACNALQIPLIYTSSDYVFDGYKKTLYTEVDTPHPVNFYGETKMLAEESVREYCQQHIILRISGLFSEYRHNFVKTILRLAKEKEVLEVIDDQFTCPTSCHDIAGAILTLAGQLTPFGTYHYCSRELISWHTFASKIIEFANPYQKMRLRYIKPIASINYPALAKRPYFSGLDCSKIKKDHKVAQPSLEEGLKKILSVL